jgi:hypothetical protein
MSTASGLLPSNLFLLQFTEQYTQVSLYTFRVTDICTVTELSGKSDVDRSPASVHILRSYSFDLAFLAILAGISVDVYCILISSVDVY